MFMNIHEVEHAYHCTWSRWGRDIGCVRMEHGDVGCMRIEHLRSRLFVNKIRLVMVFEWV